MLEDGVELAEIKVGNVLAQQDGALLQLAFDRFSVPARKKRIAMSVLLLAHHTSYRTRPASGMLGVALKGV